MFWFAVNFSLEGGTFGILFVFFELLASLLSHYTSTTKNTRTVWLQTLWNSQCQSAIWDGYDGKWTSRVECPGGLHKRDDLHLKHQTVYCRSEPLSLSTYRMFCLLLHCEKWKLWKGKPQKTRDVGILSTAFAASCNLVHCVLIFIGQKILLCL